MKFFAQRQPWSNKIALSMAQPVGDKLNVATSISMDTIKPGAATEPFLYLELEDAHALMDELWAAGVRPSSGLSDPQGSAALRAHLEDMRRLVFKETTQGDKSWA